MLFFSFFKTLVNHEVTVELKNDISIRGTLKSVDQYLNIKLDDISVVEEMKYPHLVGSNATGRQETCSITLAAAHRIRGLRRGFRGNSARTGRLGIRESKIREQSHG